MTELVLATENPGKVRELRSLLAGRDILVLSRADFQGAPEVEETGATFEANAILKAEALARFTGQTAISDDSGLEVDALDGLPGVRSARFAGVDATDAQNNAKLLAMLAEVELEQRTARFRSAIAVAHPDGSCWTVMGACEGRILEAPRGSNGFGYDPLFFVPESGQTFAEMSQEEKNRISHRGRALRAAVQRLVAELEAL